MAARYYADVPALRPLHEATVAEAFREAVTSATMPIVLTPEREEAWRADPGHLAEVPGAADPAALLDGEQDVWQLHRLLREPARPAGRALPAAVLGLPRMLECCDHRP